MCDIYLKVYCEEAHNANTYVSRKKQKLFPRLMSQGHIRTNDTLNKDEQYLANVQGTKDAS